MSAVSSFEIEPLLRLATQKFSTTSRAVLARGPPRRHRVARSLTLALFLLVSASALKGLHSEAWRALYWAARFCISSPLVRFDRSVFDVLAFPVPFRNHACRKRRQTRAGARCCLVG